MKVYFDNQIFSFQKYGGASRYYYELIKGLNQKGHKAIVGGKVSNNVYFKKIKKDYINLLPNLDFPYKHIGIFYLNNLLFEGEFKNGFDVFHPTYYHPYFLNKIKKQKYVITVLDMIHEIYEKDYKNLQNQTQEYKKKTVLGADKIMAISKKTKEDVINYYKIKPEKISITYLSESLSGLTPQKVPNLPSEYVLFIGTRSNYKNFLPFLKSAAPVLIKNKLKLVCGGGGDFTFSEMKEIEKLKLSKLVSQVSFKTDNQLAYLYRKAFIYVSPSLYEGFGIQILEAFSQNCPVITTKFGSLPEVAGQAAQYINPDEPESVKFGLNRLINSNSFRKKLIQKGKRQLKKFSWDKTVNQTINVYKDLV